MTVKTGLEITAPVAKQLATNLLQADTIKSLGLKYDETANEALAYTGTYQGTETRGRITVQRIAHVIRFIAVAPTPEGPIGLIDHTTDGTITEQFMEDFTTRALEAIENHTPLRDSITPDMLPSRKRKTK